MKTKWVATLNSSEYKVLFQFLKNSVIVFLIGTSFLIISCANDDDLEGIDNEPPVIANPPKDNESPVTEEPSVDEVPLIIYTDIEPDFNIENSEDAFKDSFNLDLNNDQIIDFTISLNKDGVWEWLGIGSNLLADNGILSLAPWYTHPVPLTSSIKISNGGYTNGEFYSSGGIFTIGDCFGGGSGCYLDWKVKDDRYLGLRFQINEEIYYGWARMNIVNSTQWTIKDYAYNATPNKSILAGQKE